MSRRLPAVALAVVASFIVAALASPLLVEPARAFGEHVFQANPIVGAGDPYYGAYGNATLAQSFLVRQDYVLTNVTLRVKNDGGQTNALVVSIHPDDPVLHLPVMSTRLASTTQASPDNLPGPVNWSFVFNPSAVLRAGTAYWIVAESTASQGPPSGGYEWHESNATSYPDGSAWLVDSSGQWTGLPYDLYFVTFGRDWASNVTLAMTADRTQALPGDPVTFTVLFNNTGDQTAPRVWINTTLSPDLANASLAFSGIQPISAASFPDLAFINVSNGAHAFTITAFVGIGTAPGTLATATTVLSFENSTGTVVRGAQASASVLVGLVTKQLYLGSTSVATKLLTTAEPTNATPASSTIPPNAPQALQFILAPPLARPFQAITVSAILWVATQKPPPQRYRLNVTLLDDGAPVESQYPSFTLSTAGYQVLNVSFGTISYGFPAGHRIGLSLWSFGGGSGSSDSLLLRYNSSAYASHLDLVTATYVAVDALSLVDPDASNTTVWSTLDPIVVEANVSDPFGSSKIAGAWINITSPTGSLVSMARMQLLATDPSAVPSWKLFGYTLPPPLTLGKYRVDVHADEDSGAADLASGYAEVVEPAFSLVDTSSAGRPQAGGAFAYFLYYNNSGTGPADDVWINETLPSPLVFVGSSLPPAWSSGNRYGWTLTDVPLGDHILEIDVNVPGSVVIQAWLRDNATLAYTDTSDHLVGNLSAHADVFVNGPILSVVVSSAPAGIIHGNETVVYTITLENLGMDSGSIWINDTLPAGFVYVGDNASSLGGSMTVAGSVLQYLFPGLRGHASEAFDITILAGASLPRNQTYINRADVAYASANGYLMPPGTASCPLRAVAPWFSLAGAAFLTPRASPAGYSPAVIRLQNDGEEAAPWVWLNVTFDTRLTVVDAAYPFTPGSGSARFVLQDVPIGRTAVYLNLTVNPNTPDGAQLPLGGSLDARDGFGNGLPQQALFQDFLFVSAASFRLSAIPLTPTIEAGTSFSLYVAIGNFGSGAASNAWLNLTIPGVLQYASDTADVNVSVVGLLYSWHWVPPNPTLLPGSPNAFTVLLRAREGTPSGTTSNVSLRLEYQDSDFVSRPAINVTVRATVLAPTLVLTVESTAPRIVSGGTFNFTVRVANRGLSTAHQVWLLDSLDPNVRLLAYASSVPASGNSTLNWTYLDLAPGEVETINLTVQTLSGLAPDTLITNSLEATYTNSQGVGLGSIRSLPVTVHIVQDLTPILWVLGAASVFAGTVVVLIVRRPKVEIEDAFLVYRDGVLISHLSRTLIQGKDEDVLSGMLTAVQEFVRDAFQYGEHRELHQLDFGDYRILIERGKYVFLAVVYSGEQSAAIRRKVRSVIELIESQFGRVLEKWDGDMDEVVGARDLIRDALLGAGHNHTERTLPQYE